MNTIRALLWAVLCIIVLPVAVQAQAPTVEGTEYAYLYRLEKEQVRWMIDSPWLSHKSPINTRPIDSMLRLRGSDPFNAAKLSRGYYLTVSTTDLTVNTYMHIYQPFFPIIQETNGSWWFVFKDTLQSVVGNGKLTLMNTDGKDTVYRYDSSCMCYPVPVQKKDRWFLFEQGESFYYLKVFSPYKKVKHPCTRPWYKFWKKCRPAYDPYYGTYGYRPRRQSGFRKFLSWADRVLTRPVSPMQINPGYVVLNQPEFKHYDTLKFKSFLVNKRGKPLKKDLYIQVYEPSNNNYYGQRMILRQKIKPVTRGAYTFEMAIPDTFAIDKQYSISICDKKGRAYKTQTFKVADYELKKVSYSWENQKQEYYRGNDIIFYAKSVDANNLPLPDATVHLKLKIAEVKSIYDSLVVLHDTVFTTWFDTLVPGSPDGLTPIHLPPHLVPNADILVYGTMEFTNADNQPGKAAANFSILADSKRYYVKEDSNGLRAGYVVQGIDAQGVKARWRVEYTSGVRREKEITLPYYQNWEPGATTYTLLDTAKNTLASFGMPYNIPKPPTFLVVKTYDSVHVQLENPLGIDVGWHIYSGKKMIDKSGGKQLSYHKKLKGTKPVHVIYTYTWAGNIFTYETTAWVKEKQLTVKINQPELVYPGQEIAVEITVTDYKRNGAGNVNLTAYSINMEFENIPAPQVPYYGKSYGGILAKKPIGNPVQWEGGESRSLAVTPYMYNWLELARHPYYALMYSPTALGRLTDSLAENKTQLSLYVKNLGAEANGQRNYYAAWIDGTMVYYRLHGYVPHAFRVLPGKHKIKFRGYEGMYETDSIECIEGMRTLVGINLDSIYNNRSISRIELGNTVDSAECTVYNQHLLAISANLQYTFSDSLAQGYLRQGNKLYKLSGLSKTQLDTRYDYDKTRYNAAPNYYYKVGPFEKGWVDLVLNNKTIPFYFDPYYVYYYKNDRVFSYEINYENYTPPVLTNIYGFADTATEFPPPPKEQPKVNVIPNYNTGNPMQHPGIRTYQPAYWAGKGSWYHTYAPSARVNQMWFINNDSLEFSNIIVQQWGYVLNQRIVPGNYDILIFTDTNSFKLLRNVQVTDSFHFYFKPSDKGFVKFDSTLLWPYIAKVKLLNRGPIPEFYKTPVKVWVQPEYEKARGVTKVIGELSINGRHIHNALVVIEDGRGNYVSGGLTNQFGFYQIPLNEGSYLVKVFTPSWDMFFVERITIVPEKNTVINLIINNYSGAVSVWAYHLLPAQQRFEQLTSRGEKPTYSSVASGPCRQNCGEIKGRITDAATGEELVGATVLIEGTAIGLYAGEDGSYRLQNISPGTYNLLFNYAGYETLKINGVRVDAAGVIFLNAQLRENVMALEAVTAVDGKFWTSNAPVETNGTVDYASAPQMLSESINAQAYTEIAVVSSERKGKNRSGSDGNAEEPDVYEGADNDDNIFRSKDSIEVNTVDRAKETERLQSMLNDTNALLVRKTFRDYGYWIPNLITNRKGMAGFTVKLPDNQTQWVTFVPAMDGKTRSGLGTAYIKAYKPLTANLSVPRVMVAGDRLEITGKAVNYTSDSVVVNALLRVGDKDLFNSPLGLRYYQLVQQFLEPTEAGETVVQYSIKMQNGYTDGELRTVPVLANGLLVNNGETHTLENDVQLALLPQPGFKNRQLLLSNRKIELLDAELKKLQNYQYGSVEQTASKLKALLLEKQFGKSLGREFKDEKAIRACIKRLEKFQNPDGSWGWWNRTATDYWMTVYAADALIRAGRAGYPSPVTHNAIGYLMNNYSRLPVRFRVSSLELFIYGGWGSVMDKINQLDTFNLTVQERYILLKARQASGQKINTAPIVNSVRHINDKQAVWGESMFNIYVNQLQTSVIAYEILRTEGGHDELLKKVRNYFLSIPHTARNSIQSATMLQTFMQDIADEDTRQNELVPALTVNGKTPVLPLKMEVGENDTINIDKKGSELFYLYSWQKFIKNPEARTDAFNISTRLVQNGRAGDTVQAGKPLIFKVDVLVEAAREYVVLEIPIPAGFSYHNKHRGYGFEIHREHFDDKVAIFFSSLPPGRHSFEIHLLPKFKGEVTLLPARAEELYYPIHFGNNTKRTIMIK